MAHAVPCFIQPAYAGDRSEMSEKPFQHTINNMAAASLGGH